MTAPQVVHGQASRGGGHRECQQTEAAVGSRHAVPKTALCRVAGRGLWTGQHTWWAGWLQRRGRRPRPGTVQHTRELLAGCNVVGAECGLAHPPALEGHSQEPRGIVPGKAGGPLGAGGVPLEPQAREDIGIHAVVCSREEGGRRQSGQGRAAGTTWTGFALRVNRVIGGGCAKPASALQPGQQENVVPQHRLPGRPPHTHQQQQ